MESPPKRQRTKATADVSPRPGSIGLFEGAKMVSPLLTEFPFWNLTQRVL